MIFIALVFGMKIELNQCVVDLDLLSSNVTLIKYDFYAGFEVSTLDNIYNEEDNTVTLSDYPHFMICYVKKDHAILKTNLFYNNEVFACKKDLRILEKIRIMTNGSEEDKVKLKMLRKIDEKDIKSDDDIMHFMITDLSETCKFVGNTREAYFRNLKSVLLRLHLISVDYRLENVDPMNKDNLVALSELQFKAQFYPLRENDFLKNFDKLTRIVLYTEKSFVEELIIPDEKIKLLNLLIN